MPMVAGTVWKALVSVSYSNFGVEFSFNYFGESETT